MREWVDPFLLNWYSNNPLTSLPPKQTPTILLANYNMKTSNYKLYLIFLWSLRNTCPLGAVFQTYSAAPSLTPDDDVFKHLSLVYAKNHAKMSRGVACKSATPAFENGITNGAAWYPLTGGMQDYQYVWYGCMEVTLEISCCKFPPAYELKKYWEDNQLVRERGWICHCLCMSNGGYRSLRIWKRSVITNLTGAFVRHIESDL